MLDLYHACTEERVEVEADGSLGCTDLVLVEFMISRATAQETKTQNPS